MILICIDRILTDTDMMTNDVGHFFHVFIDIHISSYVKCLFKYFFLF